MLCIYGLFHILMFSCYSLVHSYSQKYVYISGGQISQLALYRNFSFSNIIIHFIVNNCEYLCDKMVSLMNWKYVYTYCKGSSGC